MEHSKVFLFKYEILSVGLSATLSCRRISIWIWELGRLLGLNLLHRDGDAPVLKNELSMIAQILGVVSLYSEKKFCGGVGDDKVKVLERRPINKVGACYPFDY